jgi:uncharacterized protein (DUF427 family)
MPAARRLLTVVKVANQEGVPMTRTVKIPDATHPITIRPTGSRVTVRVGGAVVAQTDRALSLAEASYPVVQYIPVSDVDQALLDRTTTQTYCPYKGDASYYTVKTSDGSAEKDVVWTYDHPYPSVAEIAGHVAFYPDRAEITIDPA